MFERFDDESIYSLKCAEEEGRRLGSPISSYTVLLGILRAGHDELAFRALSNRGITLTQVRNQVAFILNNDAPPQLTDKIDTTDSAPETRFTSACKHVIELAVEICDRLGDQMVEPQHLLLAIMNLKDSGVLQSLEIDVDALRTELERLRGQTH